MKYFTIFIAIVVVLLLAYYYKPSFIYNDGSVQGPVAMVSNGQMMASAGQAPSGLPMDKPGMIVDPSAGANERVIAEQTAGEGQVVSAADAVELNTQVINTSANEQNAMANDPATQGVRLASCYPKEQLSAEELLPQDNFANQFAQTYPTGSGSLKDKNFLQAGHHIGVNTVGQTLRNANLQLRSEPPNPQVTVSPWLQSTIQPDLNRKPFEIGGC